MHPEGGPPVQAHLAEPRPEATVVFTQVQHPRTDPDAGSGAERGSDVVYSHVRDQSVRAFVRGQYVLGSVVGGGHHHHSRLRRPVPTVVARLHRGVRVRVDRGDRHWHVDPAHHQAFPRLLPDTPPR